MINDSIEQWYQRTPGSCLFKIEKSLLSRTLAGAMGSCFLHWENRDRYDLEYQVSFDQHIYLSRQLDFPLFTRGIQVEVQALPFLSNSIDIILLPHVLEFISNPFALIKESVRVLKPNGCLVILNFNPVSFWGLSKFLYRRKRFPWHGKSMSALYLRYLFSRMGLHVVQYKTDFFRPLLSNSQKLEKWLPLETVGQLCWPFLGAVYMVVISKQTEDLVLMKKKPCAQTSLITVRNQHPEPTTHSILD